MDRFNKYLIITAFTLVIFVTIGYAYLNTTLTINGSSKINNPTWNIHFENVQVTTGSVTANTPVINPNTTVTYSVNLSKPGDFYEFTVDAKNSGTIDAMIESINSTLNNVQIQSLPSYLNYSVTYSDGGPIYSNQELNAGTKETIKIRVEYKKDLTASDLPSTDQTLNFSFTTIYIQKDNTSIPVTHPISFGTDSWDTIISAAKSGNTSAYNVGDTKDINMGSFGTQTLRIANKSTPTECNQSNYSKTACGLVLEFTNVIANYKMNSTATNIGSWPSSEMRTYLNSTIYNSLPTDIKNNIIDTYVITGGGNTERNASPFTSTDKIYLLSAKEVWGESIAGDYGKDYTRQLDYYSSLAVSNSNNFQYAIKKEGASATQWWIRTPMGYYDNRFFCVDTSGQWTELVHSSYSKGVSPAFRIG